MAAPELAGVHHVKIPTADLPAARAWYERVFGFRVTMEFPDDDGVVRGVAGEVPGLGPAILGLRENPQAARGSRGFDPVGLAVETPEDLDTWMRHLDEIGVPHSPLIEASIGWLLVFHDPDGIEHHLYTWAEHGRDLSHRRGYGRRVVTPSRPATEP